MRVKAAHERAGRSWGVGILGFVAPELVDEQFARTDSEDVPTGRVTIADKPLN